MTTAEYDFNEHSIHHEEVRSGTLSIHRGSEATNREQVAREILTDETVSEVSVGTVKLKVWFRDVDRVHWHPPEGWYIESVSVFGDGDEWTHGAMCLDVREVDP